ncbi:biotin/lipoyl-binding protein [Kiritimatiellota bacterium B12222]|nr:biotin/lipoyl-binding protein [Kiritimatiellota bacterium B12222]
MRTYKLNIDTEKYEVEVKTFSLKTATLVVNGKTMEVNVDEIISATPAKAPVIKKRPAPIPASTSRVASGPGPAPAGGNGIKAPIPGAILSIDVKEGDAVEVGQLILTMEAMKMENQIKSTRAGKVTQLCVKPGDAVAQGQDLVIVE